MTSTKSAGALMQYALKLYQSGEAAVNEGVGIEPEDAFRSVNVVLIRVLERFLDSVQISWHESPKKQGWDNKHAVLVISYGQHIHVPIPIGVVVKAGLYQRVKDKMSSLQIKNGQIQSLRNPAQPMTWDEFASLSFGLFEEFISLVRDLGQDFPWTVMRECGVPLSEFVFLPMNAEENYRRAARSSIVAFRYPQTYILLDKKFRSIFQEELEEFIRQRRATRVACEVRIRIGTVKQCRYDYGMHVISPNGTEYSIVNSGATSFPRWNFSYTGIRWQRYPQGSNEIQFLDDPNLVPVFPMLVNHSEKWIGIDVEKLPEEGSFWRWMVYLPSAEWQIKGGSVAYLGRIELGRIQLKCDC
jgi:hypothetical protein